MIAFGPVPSRRLGRSLGINHIPPKICTYACVYCQVGRTLRLRYVELGARDADRRGRVRRLRSQRPFRTTSSANICGVTWR